MSEVLEAPEAWRLVTRRWSELTAPDVIADGPYVDLFLSFKATASDSSPSRQLHTNDPAYRLSVSLHDDNLIPPW